MPARMPTPALVLTEDGRVRSVNDLAVALLGRSPDDLLGRPLEDVLEGRRPDGTPVRLRATRTQWEHGGTICLLAEVRGAELVADVAPYFAAAIDFAPIAMAVIDSDGRYARVNDALATLVGRPAHELVGMRDNELTHPDDRARDIELAWKILRGELDAVQLEKRFVRPDGTVRWAFSNMTYLRDEHGHGIAWLGQWQDVTPLREAEAALRRERDLSAAMLAAMHEGFALTRDGVVLEVNDAMCTLTGFSRDDLVGALWPYPWVPPEAVEEQDALRARIFASEGGEHEVAMRDRAGRRFTGAMTTAPVDAPDGTRLGYVNTVRDISARKREEEELARLATHDALTGLVNHRGFHEQLHGELARAQRQEMPLSLAILDLDHFKAINDRYGHPVGDRVLAEVGRRFTALTRAGEHMCRVGGEEFAWVLPGATGPQAFAAAERARRAIEAVPFDDVGPLTVSIGVCDLEEAGTGAELHRLADVALYWAKAHGRNVVFRYTAATADELDDAIAARPTDRTARLEALTAVARTNDASPGHAERTADLAGRLAAALGWDAAGVSALREAAELHDVGKVAIPQRVLRKAGAFTAVEWEQVRRHPELGEQMTADVLDERQRAWLRGHHERWDGGGYPDGLAGEAIPLGARILAAADAFDAMTSDRGYRAPRTAVDAVLELRAVAGTQFDPQVADALIALLTAGSRSVTGDEHP